MHTNKNSWVLSAKNKEATNYKHYYFCACDKEFILQTDIDEQAAPDVFCPLCKNDYFKDTVEFESIQGTLIWKHFTWISEIYEDDEKWNLTLSYESPLYLESQEKAILISKELLKYHIKKDGTDNKYSLKSKFINKYKLYADERVLPFKEILLHDAQMILYNFIMENKPQNISWISEENIKEFSHEESLKYIEFFLQHSYLKEHEFYFWKMTHIFNQNLKYQTQVEMLDFIANHKTEKSLKKALYHRYNYSIKAKQYFAYSDYVFSRTIENSDLLRNLFMIHPTIKEHIFTDETFAVAMDFMLFLKQHYSQKQITKLFVKEMQDRENFQENLNFWRDTLRMLSTRHIIPSLNHHFIKVKPTLKNLHDEIIRIEFLISYKRDAKEEFEYVSTYINACVKYEELEFKLPKTVMQLNQWARELRNCMTGYSGQIHEQKSIIYGVFKQEQLLYAVEIKNLKIAQARASFNSEVYYEDMYLIEDWLRIYLN